MQAEEKPDRESTPVASRPSKPRLSICCLTYNHVRYITYALDSFLRQQCSFRFEIVVYDDASTDGTRDILKTFAKNHPDKIRLILSAENKLSQGINPGIEYLIPAAKGDYVALCEGDDYWLCDDKAESQVRALEQNHKKSFIYSSALTVDENNVVLGRRNYHWLPWAAPLTLKSIVMTGGGAFPTPTYMFRKSAFVENKKIVANGVGDYALAIAVAMSGEGIYSASPLAAYRIHSESYTRQRGVELIDDIYETQCALIKTLKNERAISDKIYRYVISKETYMCAARLADRGLRRRAAAIMKQPRVQAVHRIKFLIRSAIKPKA